MTPPICTLLTLATDSRVRPTAVELSLANGEWPVHSQALVEGNRRTGQFLLDTPDITVPVIAGRLDRAEKLGPLPAGIANLWDSTLPVETQILLLTTIAEGVHRVLQPDAERIPKSMG